MISPGWGIFSLLIGAVLLLMVVEALNTAIESACNAITREHHADIMRAKDSGSLAVLLSAVMAVGIWGVAVWEWLAGHPI